MKKLISLVMALVLAFGLCACGGNADSSADGNEKSTDKNPDEITLTLDNYAKYLSVEAGMSDCSIFDGGLNVQSMNNGNGISYGSGSSTFYVYKYFNTYLRVNGVSTNFNYNDVSVTVKFGGTYQTVDLSTSQWDAGNEIAYELSVECNIAGEGSTSGQFEGNGGYMLRAMADV